MTLIRCIVIAAGLGFLVGCSSQPKGAADPAFIELQEVNDLLHSATGAAGRSPTKLADLDRYQAMYPRAYAGVKSGEFVVLWGAPLRGEGEVSKGEVVVAYEKSVPADGGYVLLSAGTVKKMTAAEFGAAPKAAKK